MYQSLAYMHLFRNLKVSHRLYVATLCDCYVHMYEHVMNSDTKLHLRSLTDAMNSPVHWTTDGQGGSAHVVGCDNEHTSSSAHPPLSRSHDASQ